MSVGQFTAVNLYMMQLFQPLNMLGFVYREIKQSLVDMEQMFSLLAEHREVEDRPGAQPLRVEAGLVRFERVSFNYDRHRPGLGDVRFEVPACRRVQRLGPSGGGEATLY